LRLAVLWGLGGKVVGDQRPKTDPESCAIFSAHVTEESDSHDEAELPGEIEGFGFFVPG
jgi:hypothetical protein